jgi:tight adherence protein C
MADFLFNLFDDSSVMMLGLLVFLASATLAFSIMAVIRSRGAIRRRATGIADELNGSTNGSRSLRYSSAKAAQHLLDYTNKHFAAGNNEDTKILRRRLVQAGIFDPRAVAFFFFGRTAMAALLGGGAFLILPMFDFSGTSYWLLIMVSGIVGYVGPSVWIDRRIAARKLEHRAGFPDFMDLLVVCADSGLAMEAALDRVGRELADSYQSLSANIHMATLEIRAGRTMSEALEHLAERLALEEARSFATLIQQSDELGSSITDALRVYSDDMRHKRLSRAEEKAYSLPARLSIPMMICIFPVLFVVILLPVVVRVYLGIY